MQDVQLEKFKLKILELLFFKPQVNCGEASSLRALEFGEGCNVLRLHTRDIARGSGKLSNKGIAIDLVPNKGRLFQSFSSVDLWINCAHNCSGKGSAHL